MACSAPLEPFASVPGFVGTGATPGNVAPHVARPPVRVPTRHSPRVPTPPPGSVLDAERLGCRVEASGTRVCSCVRYEPP